MKPKLFNLFSWATLLTTFLLAMYSMFLQFWPYEVSVIENPMRTDKVCYEYDETIILRFNFDKRMDLKAEVDWLLVDGISYQLSARVEHITPGSKEVVRKFHVNEGIHSGTYHISNSITYRPTPIREINYVNRSNDFYIGECNNGKI